VLESVRDGTEFTLNGVEYPTADGTCVRDYVHVEDIARAHVAALDTALVPAGVYNLGSAAGNSNRQIISAVTDITGQTVNVTLGNARAGDPTTLTADSTKFDQHVPAWRQYTLRDMITHAWAWYNR
jgi:UDP-glucose 4-epimerase